MHNSRFPFLDLKAQFRTLRPELTEAVMKVLESQQCILGPEVEALEKSFAPLAGCQYAVGCASGSDALLLALMALEIRPGDEVITTPFTFVATAGAIARLGARPVFVDIEPDTYNLDPRRLENAINPRTRALIAVHLFGLPADMDAVLEIASRRKLHVIEDAAQSVCARYKGKAAGSLGDIGCFSFFPSKNLGAAGDGGMLTTNDSGLADAMRMLRVHGSRKKYQYERVGINSRLDALQAAILRVKLTRLETWTAARQHNAAVYRSLFKDHGLLEMIGLPSVAAGSDHVYNQFVIRAPGRDLLREHLQEAGIPTEIYYPSPLHLERAFSYLDYKLGDLAEAERASREVLALPIYPEIGEENQAAVVEQIVEFYAAKTELGETRHARQQA